MANEKAAEYLTGYLIEKSLSVDNIFVFLMLFTYFAVPPERQRKVLVLGVLGAVVLRVVMILIGAWLIARFHWILYAFGLFLLVTGIKMIVFADEKPDLERNPVLRWMRGHLAITPEFHGDRYWIEREGRRWFTPLFVVLVLIGVTDIVFAVDSIPAIFAITDDPFIVMTSNIFAVLGLRALYFVLADLAERFHLLAYGLGADPRLRRPQDAGGGLLQGAGGLVPGNRRRDPRRRHRGEPGDPAEGAQKRPEQSMACERACGCPAGSAARARKELPRTPPVG